MCADEKKDETAPLRLADLWDQGSRQVISQVVWRAETIGT